MKKLITLLMITVLLFTTACGNTDNKKDEGNNNQNTEKNVQEKVETLKLEGGVDWGYPNPYKHNSRGPGSAKMKLVYGSLLENDENGVVPWLAEKWEVDGNKYSFTLYEGAKFHDGTPLTTEDVAFTIEYFSKFIPVSNTLGSGDKAVIESYNIIDEKTIEIVAKESNATTLTTLGSFVIIPKHIWENVEDPTTYNGEDACIGSGAYKLTSYDGAAGSYEFTAFEDFKGGKPAADRILFVPVSDPILAFENGEIDITSMPADLKDKYLEDESIGVVSKDNDMGYKLLINFEKRPEFLDKAMRENLYYAMDRQAVVDKVFRGLGSVGSSGYAPSGSIFYNEDVIEYPYNKNEAEKYFTDKNLEVTMIAGNSGSDVDIAELIKIDLEAVGININVVAYDSQVRDDMINNGDYEFALVGNGGWGGKAPAYLRTIFSDVSKNKGGNPHSMGPIGYSNEKITELAEAQLLEVDFNKRVEIFKKLQMEISKEIPLIVVANQTSNSIYRKDYYGGWMKTYDYQQAEQNRLSFMLR